MESLWGPWQLWCILWSVVFWCVAWIEKKAKVLLTAALSHAWIAEYIFSYSVYGSMKVITWEGGFVCADNCRFCVEWTGDIRDTETTKAPRALIPSVAIQKNNEGWAQSPRPTESSGIFNPMSLNLICEYRRWNSLAVRAAASLSFSCMKQKGIKQLQTKVSTQLGILSSHKVLLRRLTVTFTGSENRPRGIQCLFKRHRLFMEPSEKV